LGVTTRLAARAAERALEELGLRALRARRVEHLSPVERQSVGLARSVLHEPEVVVAELPLHRLDDAAQAHLVAVLERAIHRRRSIVSFATPVRPSPELQALSRMEQLIVLTKGSCVAQGPPSELLAPGKRYVLSVKGDAALLRKELDLLGIVHSTPPRAGRSPGASSTLLIELSSGETPDRLLSATVSLGLGVLEMTPLDALVW
jgi:energy-coupling factor transporter ATP-binding protein EcfA2